MPLEVSNLAIIEEFLRQGAVKTLTLTQPWATLMAMRKKHIETRSWAAEFQGLLAIHAAKSFPGWAKELCEQEPFCSLLGQGGYPSQEGVKATGRGLPLGHIVALGWLERVDRITPTFQVKPLERALGNYALGRYAWRISEVYQLATPIEARGALGLWNWQPPESFRAEMQALYERARRRA